MIPLRYTRNLFLRGMCVVYLFSFLSFYIQIPGLYGDNGILPVRSLLENNKYKSWSAKVHYQPTLLWLAPYLGLDTQYALDVLGLLGSFLAFTGFVSQKFCTLPLFAGLWSLYFSLYQVGQVFVSPDSYFRDNLLLESGFLCLLVAPLLPGRRNQKQTYTNSVSFWLIRWLLFRFLFTTGMSQVYKGNWWDLNAFAYHFETMELPSPLSWYAHHLPVWSLRMVTIWHIVTQTILPFLFFVPIRSVRISGYSVQLLLQIFTVLTGNYNCLNLLLVTLLLSLLDDKLFYGKPSYTNGKWKTLLGQAVNVLVHSALTYAVIIIFNLQFSGSQVEAKIGISKDQLNNIVIQSLFVAAYVGLASLTLNIARSVSSAVMDTPGVLSKFLALLRSIFYAAIAMLIFISSSVPLSSLHTTTNSTISPSLRTIHNRLGKLHILNNYVVHTTSTVKQRAEIILEGSDNIEGPWHEYYFLYKPGNVNHSLPFVGPYSPRLDWQMHWAAQSTYKDQPWLLSLVHRLLQGRPEVRSLLDRTHSPFQGKPPKYIRGTLYNYKYTPWSERWQPSWWKREKVGEYFPAFSIDSPSLVDYLKARNLLPTPSKEVVYIIWKQILDTIRYVTSHLEATLLLWSVFTASCAIITTTTKNK